jgi:hypothetical protein
MSSILISLLVSVPSAHAEGSAELPGQWLVVGNELYVDIVDPESERIRFDGAGSVAVRAPDGTDLGSLISGADLSLNGLPAGAYLVEPLREQRGDWDVSVVGATDAGGRLHSYVWQLDARGYEGDTGFDGRFYARVDGGVDGSDAVIAAVLSGWTGYRWTAVASAHGVDGWDAGRSVDRYLAEVDPHIPLYLSPPSLRGDAPVSPDASGLTFAMNEVSDEFGGTFNFDVSARGTWRVVCDNLADGVVDPTNNDNVVLSGLSEGPESIEVEWSGHTWAGDYISGAGECGVTLSVGEFHFLADDIETAYPGMRTFHVDSAGSLAASPMFWNDAEVAHNDIPMANGEYPAVASGPNGVDPGAIGDTPEPDVNARSWGNFDDAGRGERAMLDTWTFADRSAPDLIDVADFGGPGDRDDSTNNLGSGFEEPEEPEVIEEVADGYFKGGCSTAGASSAGGLALVAAMVGFGLRRRDDD